MEEKRVPTEEEVQLDVLVTHLKTLSALLRNFDYEHDADNGEIEPLSESIRQIGGGLLDVDPEYYMERDALVGLADLMSKTEMITGEAIRGFSIFLDSIHKRIMDSPKIWNAPDPDPEASGSVDLSDLDIEDEALDPAEMLV